MAKTSRAHDQSMDEILASIRRMISDGDPPQGAAPPSKPAGKVSRLFAKPPEPANTSDSNVVELAIAQAMEDARVEIATDAAHAAVEAAVTAPVEPPPAPPPAAQAVPAAPDAEETLPAEAQPLLSPQADVAVAGAFNRLAATMLARSARTIDELVEDLLRPLLRNWLDANLPPLVERLVREEIERVSRGRR